MTKLPFDINKKAATIVTANKEIVDFLLELNKNNRNIRKKHLKWIGEAIEEKNFILTGQGIGVSESGDLVDGQHRLTAIRDAGYPPVEFLVVTGLSDKAKIYVDQGAKRSMADMLKIVLDKTVTNRMAATARTFLAISEADDGFVFSTQKTPLQTMVDFMTDNEVLLGEIIENLGDFGKSGIAAAIFYYARNFDIDAATTLASHIGKGTGLSESDPAYVLREMMRNPARGRKMGRWDQLQDYRYTVTACIADSVNDPIQNMRPSDSWGRLAKSDKQKKILLREHVRTKSTVEEDRRSTAA
jgi:hypothetical protein